MRQRFAAAVIAGMVWASGAVGQGCPAGHWEYLPQQPPGDACAKVYPAGDAIIALGTAALPDGSVPVYRWRAEDGWTLLASMRNAAGTYGVNGVNEWQGTLLITGGIGEWNGEAVTDGVQYDLATWQRITPPTLSLAETRNARWVGRVGDGLAALGVNTSGGFRYDRPLSWTTDGTWLTDQQTFGSWPIISVTQNTLYVGVTTGYGGGRWFFDYRRWDAALLDWSPDPVAPFHVWQNKRVRFMEQSCSPSSTAWCPRLDFFDEATPVGTVVFVDETVYNARVSGYAGLSQYVLVTGNFTSFDGSPAGRNRVLFNLAGGPAMSLPPGGGTVVAGVWNGGVLTYSCGVMALWRPGCDGNLPPMTARVVDEGSLGALRLPAVVCRESNGKYAVFGGRDATGADSARFARWDGREWATVNGSVPSARADHAIANSVPQWSDGGFTRPFLVMFGGKTSDGTLLDDTWANFNALEPDGVWSRVQTSASPSARGGHAMACSLRSRVVVMFGGFEQTGLASPVTHLFIQPGQYPGYWQSLTIPGPSARFAHVMGYDELRNRIVLFGGRGAASQLLGDTWEFDTTTNTWTQRAISGPSARDYAAMNWDAHLGGLRLSGGRDATGARADQWLLTATGWQRLDDLPDGPRWAHAAAGNREGEQLIVGGIDSAGVNRSSTLLVSRSPVLLSEPTSTRVPRGATVQLEVVAAAPSGYQWYRNGRPIPHGQVTGQIGSVLTINQAALTDAGEYVVKVTNSAGTSVSRPVTVTVDACDTIDFNNNGAFPEDQDVVDFFTVLGGGACSAGNTCNDIDFNNNGVYPEEQDVIDFFNVLAGGECV